MEAPDRQSAGLIEILSTPLIWFLIGSCLAVISVKYFFRPEWFWIFLVSYLAFGLLGVLVIAGRPRLSILGLVLVGVGIFGVYGILLRSNYLYRQKMILNRRLHLEGRYVPPDRFKVERINGKRFPVKLYFNRSEKFSDVQTVLKDKKLSLTGEVKWFSLPETFRDYLRTHDFHGYLRKIEIHKSMGTDFEGPDIISQVYGSVNNWLDSVRGRAPYSTMFLRALLTGEKEFPQFINTVLKRLGLVHFFVISGLHVGILFYVVSALFFPVPKPLRVVLIMFVLVAYLSFLGWPVSALRAALMLVLGGLVYFFSRRSTMVDLILAVVVIMMLLDPFVIVDVGFQLSIGALFGIAAFFPSVKNFNDSSLLNYAFINFGAYIGTFPVVLYHFQYIAPLAVIGGFLIGVIFPLILFIMSLQLLFLLINWSALHSFLEGLLEVGLTRAYDVVSSGGFVWGTQQFSSLSIVIVSLLLFVTLFIRKYRISKIFVLVFLVLTIGLSADLETESHLEVRLINELPVVFHKAQDGKRLVIIPPGGRLSEYRIHQLKEFLTTKGVQHLDYLVSDYGKRLLHQFDPEFTVGNIVPYWSDKDKVNWNSGYINLRDQRLSSSIINIDFNRRQYVKGLETQVEGLFGITNNEYCLVNDSSFLDNRVFKALKGSKCSFVFLKEGPVKFTGEDSQPLRAGKGEDSNPISLIFTIFNLYLDN